MPKLTMTTRPDKASVNNSADKAIGVTLSLDQLTRTEPFASLFMIKPEILAAIMADMAINGFDPSKPVNVWKKPDGTRILIDGYTRVAAAESLGLLHVTAYEKPFASESEAMAYAIHTQRDRRNLSDAELLRLIVLLDQPQIGFNTPVAAIEATGVKPKKTAEVTADTIGTSRAKVERARAVIADPDEAAAVLSGAKTIHQAAHDAKAKRTVPPTPAKRKAFNPETQQANDEAVSEGLRIIGLLHELLQRDPSASRRRILRSAIKMLRLVFT